MGEVITINIEQVAARMKLSVFNTTKATFRRQHKAETEEVNRKHQTGNAARVSVLQCSHPNVQAIGSLQGVARGTHYDLTLPSIQDGMRLVAVGREFEHSERINECVSKQITLVEEMVVDGCYVGGRQYQTDEVRLNGLFEDRAWPKNPDALRNEYSMTYKYLSCPTDGAWADWLAESARAADAEVKSRLEKALKHVAERCSSDGRLFESVFSNLEDLLKLVPDFDLAGKYKQIADAAAELTMKANIETLRDDKNARKEVAKRANKIVDMFGDLSKLGEGFTFQQSA